MSTPLKIIQAMRACHVKPSMQKVEIFKYFISNEYSKNISQIHLEMRENTPLISKTTLYTVRTEFTRRGVFDKIDEFKKSATPEKQWVGAGLIGSEKYPAQKDGSAVPYWVCEKDAAGVSIGYFETDNRIDGLNDRWFHYMNAEREELFPIFIMPYNPPEPPTIKKGK